jgi:hypothetical protein
MPLIATCGAGGTNGEVVSSISACDTMFLHTVSSPLVAIRSVAAVLQLGDSKTCWCSVRVRHSNLKIREDISSFEEVGKCER